MMNKHKFVVFDKIGLDGYLASKWKNVDTDTIAIVPCFYKNKAYFFKHEIDSFLMSSGIEHSLDTWSPSKVTKMSLGEKQFSDFLTINNKTWTYEPCRLDTGVPCEKARRNIVYIPDFWCPEDNCYYEVSCTRQAKEQSEKKINMVIEAHPEIKIIIVYPDGHIYGKPNGYRKLVRGLSK